MKRLYMTLGLAGAMALGVNAQQLPTVDLTAIVALPEVDDVINPGATLSGTANGEVLLAITMQPGNFPIYSGENVWYITPFVDSGYMSGVSWQSDLDYDPAQDGGFGMVIYNFPNDNEVGMGHTGPNMTSADSIKSLMDWNAWNSNQEVVKVYPPFEEGKDYGFFFEVRRVGIVGNEGVNWTTEDPNMSDNISVTKIKWGTESSIAEMFAAARPEKLDIYPNPAQDVVNFTYKFDKSVNATVNIMDISGRIISSEDFGKVNVGAENFTINVANLPAGSYVIELVTEEGRGTSKFTKN